MHRPDQRQTTASFGQQHEALAQGARVIHVRGPVQRHDAVSRARIDEARIDPFVGEGRGRRDRALPMLQERIDHHIAGELDALRGYAFARQVGFRCALGRVQAVRDLVGEHPVDLFGHATIEAAQPGFDVHDANRLLGRDETAGEGRVHIADDDHARRTQPVEHRLESLHDLGCLHRVRARAGLEIDVGGGQLEVREQSLVHRDVVVLAGVYEHGLWKAGMGGECAQKRRHLHVIGPCANHACKRPHRSDVSVHQRGLPGLAGLVAFSG